MRLETKRNRADADAAADAKVKAKAKASPSASPRSGQDQLRDLTSGEGVDLFLSLSECAAAPDTHTY